MSSAPIPFIQFTATEQPANSSLPAMQSTFAVGETDSEREECLNSRKRPRRTANACVRCKARKQRCDLQEFDQGPCRSCQKANVPCILAEKIKKSAYPDDYVRSLETRVADLESHLRLLQPSGGFGNDHWDQSSPTTSKGIIANIDSSCSLPGLYTKGWESTTDDGTEEEGQVARGIALLSLNSAAEPHYIGASSGWSWAKTVLGTLGPSRSTSSRGGSCRFRDLPDFKHKRKLSPAADLPRIPSLAVSEVLICAVYEHIQARYPFQCWKTFNSWHAERDKYIAEEPRGREEETAAFFIWLIYATGARLLETTHLPGLHPPEIYYAKAMEYLDTIVTLHNLANIQAFLLLAIYSLRCAEGPSVWHLVGLALRLSVELGLHRKASRQARLRDPYTVELRRRIFWSVYGLDRFLALTMGRPLGIQDADIDVELPMDVDFSDDDDTALRTLSEKDMVAPSSPCEPPASQKPITSMTSALHIIKCRQIESEIQRVMYHVDRAGNNSEIAQEASRLLGRLDRWKTNIPQKPVGPDPPPCCSPEWFSWRYFEATLFLLRPLTVTAQPSDPLLSRCAHAAAGAVEAQRRLHQIPPVSLSLSALHSVFLSGLTLLHCMHLNRRIVTPTLGNRAIRACSNTLFLYAQHFVAAEPFRDAFEDLANACLDDDSDMDTMGGPMPIVVESKRETTLQDEGTSIPLWGSQLDDMSKLMTEGQRDSFYALVSSLGFSTPSTDTPMDLTVAPSLAVHTQQFLATSAQPIRGTPAISPGLRSTADVDLGWSPSSPSSTAALSKRTYQEGGYW